jgi:hypothetical protein
MSSRRILIATCLLAMGASPAVPQTIDTPTAISRQPSSALVSAAMGPPPSMRELLRAWGLDRPSRNAQFRKRESNAERASFSALIIKDKDGRNVTLDNLVITRNNQPGATFGQFTITADKLDDANGTQIGRVSLIGLRGDANLLDAFKAVSHATKKRSLSSTPAPPATLAFVEMIALSDITTTISDNTDPFTARVGQLEITNVSLDTELRSFDVAAMKDAIFDFQHYSVKLNAIEVSGMSAEKFTQWAAKGTQGSPPFDVLSLALGHFSFNGLSYTSKTTNGRPSSVNTITVDRFSIDNIKDGFMGQFSMTGLKLGGGAGANTFQIGLNRVAVGGLNMRYFGEFGSAMQLAMTKASPKPAQSGPPPSSARNTTPAVTPATTSRPRILIRDVMKGGPLDGGMRSFDLGGLTATGAGFGFTIDQLGLTQVRDQDDIVTRTDLIPTTWRFSWPTQPSGKANPLTAMLKSIGTDHITLRVAGSAKFNRSKDQVNVDNYEMELVDWGKIKIDFAMSGIDKLMSEVSIDELFAATLPAGRIGSPENSKQQMSQIFKLYKGVTIDMGRFEVSDLGGIDTAARLSLSTGRRGTTSNAPVTAAQKRTVRDSWASIFRSASGDKSKPALEREFSVAAARWLETGGVLVFSSNPPTPVPFSVFENAATVPPSTWGLRISNRSASVASPR